MLGHLLPAGGGQSVPLLKARLVIGRGTDCDITVSAKGASSRHCELVFKDGVWYVRDLDSRNGTGVNNRRITKQRLMPDDILIVGKQRFKVRYQLPKAEENRRASKAEDLALEVLTEGSPPPNPADTKPRPDSAPQRPQVSRAAAENPTVLFQKAIERDEPRVQHRQSRSRLLGRLIPCGGGDPIPLMQDSLLVGRRSHCDVQIKNSTVSSEHCRLEMEDGYWFIQDIGSHNGVRVAGTKVERECLLPDVVISIAKVRFTIDYRPPTDGPPPMVQPFAKSLLAQAGLEREVASDKDPSWMQVDDEPITQKKYKLDMSELDEEDM